MIYTYDALRRQVLRELDEEDDAPTTEVLAGDYINQAHQMRALRYAQYFLLHPKEVTFETVPGQRRYTLNPMVSTILYLHNDTTKLLVREVPNRGLATGEFDWKESTGSASEYMFWGHSQVKTQPTEASVVWVTSSSTSDTGSSYQVVVKGILASGDVVAELLTLSGTTPVAGTEEFEEILSVTKSGEFNGTLTVTANAGATSVVSLSPLEMGKQYRQIYLVQEPEVAETLSYRFYRKPLVLINDYDIPEIPSPYSQILVWDALILFAGYNTDIRPETVAAWRQQRDQWEEALEQYLKDSNTLGAQPLFVQNKEGDWAGEWPTFGG